MTNELYLLIRYLYSTNTKSPLHFEFRAEGINKKKIEMDVINDRDRKHTIKDREKME